MEYLVNQLEDNQDKLAQMGLTVPAAVILVMKHLTTSYHSRLQRQFAEHVEELFKLAPVEELTSSEMRSRLREHEPNVVLQNRVAVDRLVQAIWTGQLENDV